MPVYLIGRGIGYHREGIDDVGDIYEIFEGPEPPSGPGYALSDIIAIEVLSKDQIEIILNTIRPVQDYDPITKKRYWQNPEDNEWYEIKIKPKYDLNFANLNLEDRATLADRNATSVEQIAAMEKIMSNIAKYSQNTETLKPNG